MTRHGLSEAQIRALKQIGFGVFGRRGGFYDELDERLDGRSWPSLLRRGLAFYGTKGGAPMIGTLDLTIEGYELLEQILEEEADLEDRKRRKRW